MIKCKSCIDRLLIGDLKMKLNTSPRKIFNSIRLAPPQILVLGFAIIIMIGTILLNLPMASKNGESIGLLNALFTATSAVCVTGLVVVDTATHWTAFGHTVIIFLIQIGGLGFMTMTTLFFLVTGKRITIKERILIQSSLNQDNLSGVVRFSKYILVFTFLLEGLGALVLSTRFIPIYGTLEGIGMSIFHSISAFCNAGFDLVGNFRSFTMFKGDSVINFTIMILIIVGGLGFSVVLDIIKNKKLYKLSTHSKLILTITFSLTIFGAVVIFILEKNNPATLKFLDLKGQFLGSLFHSVTPRTAGFNTLDMSSLTDSTIFLTIVMMFIGGSPGSTAGGVKTATIGILLATVISVLRGQNDTEIYKRRISIDLIRKALAIVMIAGFIIIAITMLLSITEEATFMEVLFEVVSAFGTVGLSLGITPELSLIGRIAIIFTMFIGRVGPLTIGFAIAQRQAKKDRGNYRYPKANIRVG